LWFGSLLDGKRMPDRLKHAGWSAGRASLLLAGRGWRRRGARLERAPRNAPRL